MKQLISRITPKQLILFVTPIGLLCAFPLKENPSALSGLFLALAGITWLGLFIEKADATRLTQVARDERQSLQQAQETIAALTARCEVAEAKQEPDPTATIDSQKATIAEQTAKIEDMNQRVESAKASLEGYAHETENAQAGLAKLRADCDLQRAEGDRLRAESEQLREESERLRQEGDKLRAESEQLQAGSDRLRAESERLRQEGRQLRQEGSELDEECKLLRHECARLKEEITRLTEEHDQTAARIGGMADELAGQIVVSLSEAEQAITSAIEAFTEIAQEAQLATEIAQQAVGKDDGASIVEITTKSKEVMSGFIQGMLLTSHKIGEMSQQLQKLTSVATQLKEPVADIDKMAAETVMIAMNLSQEAAKAGKSAPALEAISDQVRHLGERSHKAAEQMRERMRAMNTETEAVSKSLASVAETSQKASGNAQKDVHLLAGLLHSAATQSKEALASLSEKNANIETHLSDIITAFQFHDLLRQRLEHVAKPLCELRDSLKSGETPANEVEEETQLAYAVGGQEFSIKAAGAAPSLQVVDYTAQEEDDSVTLF